VIETNFTSCLHCKGRALDNPAPFLLDSNQSGLRLELAPAAKNNKYSAFAYLRVQRFSAIITPTSLAWRLPRFKKHRPAAVFFHRSNKYKAKNEEKVL